MKWVPVILIFFGLSAFAGIRVEQRTEELGSWETFRAMTFKGEWNDIRHTALLAQHELNSRIHFSGLDSWAKVIEKKLGNRKHYALIDGYKDVFRTGGANVEAALDELLWQLSNLELACANQLGLLASAAVPEQAVIVED